MAKFNGSDYIYYDVEIIHSRLVFSSFILLGTGGIIKKNIKVTKIFIESIFHLHNLDKTEYINLNTTNKY